MGWAQRANQRRQGNFRYLTAIDCRRISDRIRMGLAALDITLPPTASVEQMARDAEWLGSGPYDLFASGSKREEDADRFLKSFMRMEQAGRIANLLVWAGGIEGVRDHAKRWIRHRIDRIETQDEQAQDLFFELEIAGRLARWPDLAIQFAEPDILIRYPPAVEQVSALACKRPRTRGKALSRAIKKAREQINKSGYHAAIVVGTEALFHRSENPLQPQLFEVESPAEVREWGEEILDSVVAEIQETGDGVFNDPYIAGIFFCGVLTYWSRRPSAYGYAWFRRSIPNRVAPHAREVMDAINHLLFESPH